MNLSRWCRKNNAFILGTVEQFRRCNNVMAHTKFTADIGGNFLVMVYDGYALSVPCDCCQELFLKGGIFLNA